MKEDITTSRLALYYWNFIWLILLLILCPGAILSTIAIFNPDTKNAMAVALFLVIILIIIYKLLMIIIWSKNLVIGNHGIRYSKGLVKWDRVVKVTGYRGWLPVISIKLSHGRPSRLMGVFPIFSGMKKLRTVMNAVEAKGIKTTRWLV